MMSKLSKFLTTTRSDHSPKDYSLNDGPLISYHSPKDYPRSDDPLIGDHSLNQLSLYMQVTN